MSEPSLKRYHLLPSVRGELLKRLGRFEEARAELERAASLTRNARERELLRERAAACARQDRSTWTRAPRQAGSRPDQPASERKEDS